MQRDDNIWFESVEDITLQPRTTCLKVLEIPIEIITILIVSGFVEEADRINRSDDTNRPFVVKTLVLLYIFEEFRDGQCRSNLIPMNSSEDEKPIFWRFSLEIDLIDRKTSFFVCDGRND